MLDKITMSHFDHMANSWDKSDVRQRISQKAAKAIAENMQLSPDMEIMDFGVGTGLLGFEIAKKVKQVYRVDTSLGMIEQLKAKNTDELNIIPFHQDIIKNPINRKFHGVISSMTLHHVSNLVNFFSIIHQNLLPGGFIAIADLEKEDGSFHRNNDSVFHFGFDKNKLQQLILNCGFKDIEIKKIHVISKLNRDFGVFLLTAIKKIQ